ALPDNKPIQLRRGRRRPSHNAAPTSRQKTAVQAQWQRAAPRRAGSSTNSVGFQRAYLNNPISAGVRVRDFEAARQDVYTALERGCPSRSTSARSRSFVLNQSHFALAADCDLANDPAA